MGPSELAAARYGQSSTLVDDCRVGPLVRGTLDEATGTYTQVVEPVWSGLAGVKRNLQATEVDSGGRLLTVTSWQVSLPVEGTEAVREGMVVEVVRPRYDPSLQGARVVLTSPAEGSVIALRRFEGRSES